MRRASRMCGSSASGTGSLASWASVRATSFCPNVRTSSASRRCWLRLSSRNSPVSSSLLRIVYAHVISYRKDKSLSDIAPHADSDAHLDLRAWLSQRPPERSRATGADQAEAQFSEDTGLHVYELMAGVETCIDCHKRHTS